MFFYFCRTKAIEVKNQPGAVNDYDCEYYFPTVTSPLLFDIKNSWIIPNTIVFVSLIGKGKDYLSNWTLSLYIQTYIKEFNLLQVTLVLFGVAHIGRQILHLKLQLRN